MIIFKEFVGRLAMSSKASMLLQKMKPSISDNKETVNTTTNEKSSATANSTRFSETFINSDSSSKCFFKMVVIIECYTRVCLYFRY